MQLENKVKAVKKAPVTVSEPSAEVVDTSGNPRVRSFQCAETCEIANGRRTFQQNDLTDLKMLHYGIQVTTKTGQLGKHVLNQVIIPFSNIKAILLESEKPKC